MKATLGTTIRNVDGGCIKSVQQPNKHESQPKTKSKENQAKDKTQTTHFSR
jgi:hypothetical protein